MKEGGEKNDVTGEKNDVTKIEESDIDQRLAPIHIFVWKLNWFFLDIF